MLLSNLRRLLPGFSDQHIAASLRHWRKMLACRLQGHIYGHEIDAKAYGEGSCVRCGYDIEDGWRWTV